MDRQELSDNSRADLKLWSTFHDNSKMVPNEVSKDKYYNYWNRSVQKEGLKKRKHRKLKEPREDPSEKDVIHWMNEEDPEAEERKMLRLLYLLPTQEDINSN